MVETWLNAYTSYDWNVDLAKYDERQKYPGYFNTAITPRNTIDFENKFRESLQNDEYQVAGEVCFWKNYGIYQSRNRLTAKLLEHLSQPPNWIQFKKSLLDLHASPTHPNFETLRRAMNQPRGFATPLTFLSFYGPAMYPMVDKNIAYWWALNKSGHGFESSRVFSQRSDGWIQSLTPSQTSQNWEAYLDWARFCCDYSKRITGRVKMNYRARDIEMAVWMACKKKLPLNTLEK